MKRILLLTLSAFLLIGSGIAIGSSINGDFNGNPIVKVTYNGKELKTDDTPAVIYNDRAVVPLYLLKQLGYELSWDSQHYAVDIKPTEQNANRRKLTTEEITKLGDQVGYLLNYGSNGNPHYQGSGFVINKDGLLISAHHMLSNSTKMVYENNNTSTFTKPDFDSPQADLFGVTLGNLPENKGKTFPYLNYTTELPKIGETVYAIGYPGGQKTVSVGIVNQIVDSNGIKEIRSSAATDHGSSGGVLMNEWGEVIGVTIEGDGGTSIAGYAVPMMYVENEINKLK